MPGEIPSGWERTTLGGITAPVNRTGGSAELPVLSVSKVLGIVPQSEKQYRGRGLMLDVKAIDVAQVSIIFRSKFHVVVPVDLDPVEKLKAVRETFDRWFRERALDEVERFGHAHEATLGVQAAGYRLSEARSRWGSCGRPTPAGRRRSLRRVAPRPRFAAPAIARQPVQWCGFARDSLYGTAFKASSSKAPTTPAKKPNPHPRI